MSASSLVPIAANDHVLTRAQAAALCGITPGRFSAWVSLGIAPSPIKGTRRWSHKAVVAAIEQDNRQPSRPLTPEEAGEAALQAWLDTGVA